MVALNLFRSKDSNLNAMLSIMQNVQNVIPINVACFALLANFEYFVHNYHLYLEGHSFSFCFKFQNLCSSCQ